MNEQVKHLDFAFPVRAFPSRPAWERYAVWLRRHVGVSLGVLPVAARPPVRAEIFGRWEGNGYICEKVAIESLPGFFLTGNLFRPRGTRGPKRGRPGVLQPHGHWSNGRLHDFEPAASVVMRNIHLARMGAVSFSYDMIGYGDSGQLPHGAFPSDPDWGLSLAAAQTWHSLRAFDFVAGLPEVDASRIGVTGASGGGTQTFLLCALEGRLRAAAPICMISQHFQGGCVCENAPLLRLHATNVEIARLFAPRPLFLGSCTGDWTRNTPTVEQPAIRAVYRLYGAADRVAGLHIESGHNYNVTMRQAVYGFFRRWLFGAASDAPVTEDDVIRPPLRDQMVWWGRPAPPALSAARFRVLWQARQKALLAPILRNEGRTQRELVPLLGHVLGIPEEGVTAPGQGAVCLQRDGMRLTVKALTRGAGAAPKVNFFDTYNLPAAAEAVQGIAAALRGGGPGVTLTGHGEAGLWCLLAAAVTPAGRVAAVEASGVTMRDEEACAARLRLPGFRQIGGMATVRAALRDKGVRVR